MRAIINNLPVLLSCTLIIALGLIFPRYQITSTQSGTAYKVDGWFGNVWVCARGLGGCELLPNRMDDGVDVDALIHENSNLPEIDPAKIKTK